MISHAQQHRQDEHDRLFHFDIYTLSKHHRLAHLTLHMAKYNGKLLECHSEDAESYRMVAVDAFIVLTSIFNTVNICIKDTTVINDYMTSRATWCIETLVVETGKLCKVIESIDHLEHVDVRGEILHICSTLLSQWLYVWNSARSHDHYDLHAAILKRLVQVEKKNIFYGRIVEDHPHLAEI